MSKYEFKETSNHYAIITDTITFRVNKYAEENQDYIYNEVLVFISNNETTSTLNDIDIQNINMFMNTSKHTPKLDIQDFIGIGGGIMTSKTNKPKQTKKKTTKTNTQKKDLLPVVETVNNIAVEPIVEVVSNAEMEHIIEQEEITNNYKQVTKCYHCGNKEYIMKRQVWGNIMFFYTFDGKLKEKFDECNYEPFKRIYCNECGTCLGTLDKNLFLDVNTNQLFIKEV